MASDAESDGFGAFDLSEFTQDDFAQIDTDIANHFQPAADLAFEDESFEFDASLDLCNLTEEDLLEIDNAVTLHLNVAAPTPVPPPPIPGPSKDPVKSPAKPPWRYKGKKKAWEDRTLLEKYRPSGVVSVSDLVGPAWCEVQFDYGLRQKRSRPIDKRPKSFKTSTGKEISVESKVAQINDARTKQGQAIHKELEREVRAEEVKIDVKSDEERWGIRLLNLIACFQMLVTEGMTREMPVFGLANGTVVIGIIDEICRIEQLQLQLLGSPERGSRRGSFKASKRRRRTPSHNQTDIEDFILPQTLHSSKAREEGSSIPCYSLQISDTKTRVADSLPAEADTLGPRLQAMLYLRLLSELISTEAPFDFDALWYQLGINSTVEFSTEFLVQAGLLANNDGFPTTNLDGLVDAWKRMLKASSIDTIDPVLQLVYRLQPKGAARPNGKGKDVLRIPPRKDSPSTAEARDIARAIRNSLLESSRRVDGMMEGQSKTLGLDVTDIDVELQDALYKSLGQPLPTGQVEEPEVIETDIHGYKIIGTKEFVYDPITLQNHLDSVFELWRGERPPIGVPVELARRCNTCEYRTGCEWREEKATEFITRRDVP